MESYMASTRRKQGGESRNSANALRPSVTKRSHCGESTFRRRTGNRDRSRFRWFVHTAPPYNEFWDYSFRSAELNLPIRPDSVLISNSRFETDLKGLLAHLCCDPWSNRKGQSSHLPSKYFTDFKKSSVSVGSSQ